VSLSLSPCSPFLIDARSPRSVPPSKNTLRQTPKKKKETYVAGLAAQPPHKRRRRSFTTITSTTQPVSQLPTIESSYRWTPYLSFSLSRETTPQKTVAI
jgi:hypothetical protein